MELTVEAFNLVHAEFCLKNEVDNLILGNEIFSTRIAYSFNESEIQKIVKNKKNTKIWIKVNTFFFEQDLSRLTSYLKWLSTINIDYVIFQDFAVAQINQENFLGLRLHYNPETLVTSYGQFDLYRKANFHSVFIARELMMNELEIICQNKSQLKVEVQGHGYGFIMHSRWKLISNFEKYYHTNIDKDFLLIQEKLRKYPNLIFEDKHGTHLLTGFLIYTIDILDNLKTIGIDYLKLDFLKTNEQYACETTRLYLLALKSKEDLLLPLINLAPTYIISHNFFGGPSDVLHMKKEEND